MPQTNAHYHIAVKLIAINNIFAAHLIVGLKNFMSF